MKREHPYKWTAWISFLLILILPFTSVCAKELPEFPYYEGVYIFDAKSGDLIYEQNENDRYEPASTTKLMTALLLMKHEGDNLAQKVSVGDEVDQFGFESSTAGLESGQVLTYEELLYAMLLPSGNDAAEVIAVNIGRKLLGADGQRSSWKKAVNRFVEEMNNEARNMGLKNTHFKNAHGLEDPDHYTTPEDYAVIASKALTNETIKKVAGTKRYTIKDKDGKDLKLESTNLYLYSNADDYGHVFTEDSSANPYYTTDIKAAKTGYTDAAGRTYTFYSDVNGLDLIGVLFKTENNDIFTQSKAVAEAAKETYELKAWTGEDAVYDEVKIGNLHYGNGNSVVLKGARPIYSLVEIGTGDSLQSEIVWNEDYVQVKNGRPRLAERAQAGTEVATLQITNGDKIVKEVPLFTKEDIQPKGFTDFLLGNLIWIVLAVLLYFFYKRYFAPKKKKKGKPGLRTVQRSSTSRQSSPGRTKVERKPVSGVRKASMAKEKNPPKASSATKSASRREGSSNSVKSARSKSRTGRVPQESAPTRTSSAKRKAAGVQHKSTVAKSSPPRNGKRSSKSISKEQTASPIRKKSR